MQMNIKGKKILITGGAGFIGSNIAEKLLKMGAKVRVMDNLLTGRRSNIAEFLDNPNFEFFEKDITNISDCRAACDGIDLVTHQAALGSVPRSIINPSATNEINSGGFVNMLFAAKEAGIKRFVYASSSSVYGDEPNLPKREEKIGKPLSPYAVSKLTNELYAAVFGQTYGMEVIGLRYFNVYGPKQDPEGVYAAVIPLFLKHLFNNEAPFINGDGEQTRDFTYVDNAVQANLLGLTTTNNLAYNQVYNVAVGEKFSVNEMYEMIRSYLNKDIAAIHREERSGDIRDSLADISKAKNLLGYSPQFTFKQGLPLTIEYFKNEFQ
ncbi:MAG: SDR family oxidoreductase [Chitinophagales bacterium]|jgi:UDP-N-acetylglucosamine 4-epimerase|nr:SDR family oxidoreductase [Chitinophagales bacterium]MBP9135805.1 SDR family oxidoreductase [Chitinophagales bacterium]